MKKAALFLLILFCIMLASPSNAEYRWKVVGGNPYKGTTEWAIGNSGWPDPIQMALLVEFLADRLKDGKICGGTTLDFVTFGNKGIEKNVYTDWSAKKCYATTEYSAIYEGTIYTLVNIWKCGNWGGYSIKDVEKLPETTPLPSDKPDFMRGGLVQFNCPTDGIGCSNC